MALTKVKLTNSSDGILPVTTGGTGVATITGILKGTGTSALTAATANTDYLAPTGNDTTVTRQMFKDCGYTVYDIGNINNATVTFDYTNGSVQTYTATGSTVTWAFSNWPPTGNLGEILIIATNAGAYTHTINGVTWLKPDGTTTTSFATYLGANTGRTALQTSGVDQFVLWSRDAGTTVYGKLV